MTIITKKSVLESLGLSDAPSAAQDFINGLYGEVRHDSRVAATIEAAGGPDGAFTSGKILLDLIGRGGRGGTGVDGQSERHPDFQVLGKGRWNATDGNAFLEASRNALRKLNDGLSLNISISHDDDEDILISISRQIQGEDYPDCIFISATGEIDIGSVKSAVDEGWVPYIKAMVKRGILVSRDWPHGPTRELAQLIDHAHGIDEPFYFPIKSEETFKLWCQALERLA